MIYAICEREICGDARCNLKMSSRECFSRQAKYRSLISETSILTRIGKEPRFSWLSVAGNTCHVQGESEIISVQGFWLMKCPF